MDDDPFAMPDDFSQEKVEPKPGQATKPEAAKPTARTAAKMASEGKIVNLPEETPVPSWPRSTAPDDSFMPDESLDFTDLTDLNREINRARARSFRIKNALADARRLEAEETERYRRAYNRILVGISGGNAEHRKAMAEIQTEELYTKRMIAESTVKELVNLSYAVSRDLDTLKVISDNLRKQLSM